MITRAGKAGNKFAGGRSSTSLKTVVVQCVTRPAPDSLKGDEEE